MSRFKRIFLCNTMLAVVMAANIAAYVLASYLDQWLDLAAQPHLPPTLEQQGYGFDLAAFGLTLLVMLWWEWPLRRFLRRQYQKRETDPKLLAKARRRLLNEPYVAVAATLFFWLLGALFYAHMVYQFESVRHLAWLVVMRAVVTGMITGTLSFFMLEHISQHRLAPLLFPQGGISATRGVWRIRVGTRLVALLVVGSLVPFVAIILHIKGNMLEVARGFIPPVLALDNIQVIVVAMCVIFMACAIILAMLVTANIVRPLKDIVRVLDRVRRGRFEERVRVVSNDEIGYTGDAINLMSAGLAERDFIKETFGKYVSKRVRDEILAGRIPLDGESMEVTVLFADLRNFTPLVEATPPKQVVKIINGYFDQMSQAVNDQGGLVLQFIGDEIEAVFGAPLPLTGHAERAVRSALSMRDRLVELNQHLSQQGYGRLMHGIGIHTGRVVAANIGSPERLSYALVGGTVNLASRLQGLNKDFGTDILVSASTASGLNGNFTLRAMPAASVKGISHPVEIFSLP